MNRSKPPLTEPVQTLREQERQPLDEHVDDQDEKTTQAMRDKHVSEEAGLTRYDKDLADSFPASDPAVQP